MGKKSRKNRRGVVYSTNPDYEYEHDSVEEEATWAPAEQKLRVMIDRKRRKGKEVTLVTGFVGTSDDLKELGRFLKSKCGAGGSVKDGEIIVQGNNKQKIIDLLLQEGYKKTKGAGG